MTGTPRSIAITGASGFLGWHLRCRLQASPLSVRLVPDEAFGSVPALVDAIGSAGCVIHLAGMNRGPDAEVLETNLHLARQLTEALDVLPGVARVLFANSIHCQGETPFGRSKRGASELLRAWETRHGASFFDVIIPHLFGEGGRPFYNSAVATFCHLLAHGEEPVAHAEGQVELIHAQRVASIFLDLAERDSVDETVRIWGTPMPVTEALGRLKRMDAAYRGGVLPDLSEPLGLDLFNAYRSYLYPSYYPVPLKVHADQRGGLFEAVKTQHGGQAFLSLTKPGIVRGRHYHRHKVERFLVIQGEAEIRVRRLFDDVVQVFRVSGDAPGFIDIPTLHTHEIANVGESDLMTLFWAHEIFDPEHPDTYPEPVILEQ